MTDTEICECGFVVRGLSPNQLIYNVKMHKKGNKHKLQMQLRKQIEVKA